MIDGLIEILAPFKNLEKLRTSLLPPLFMQVVQQKKK